MIEEKVQAVNLGRNENTKGKNSMIRLLVSYLPSTVVVKLSINKFLS